MKDDLLIASEASRFLRRHGVDLTPAALRYCSDAGQLHAYRTPTGVRLFLKPDLERFAQTRRDAAGTRLSRTSSKSLKP